MTTYTATYSPDDNKLRLTATERLDQDTYARVSAVGFRWAPKQRQFICPAWNPEAADVCQELAGSIEDEDSTLMERAEARSERFEEYSEKRADEGARHRDGVQQILGNIPLGQPILVGHHSEARARRDIKRMESGMRQSIKAFETSDYWSRRAEAAKAHAEYSERPDVRARRIKRLEAECRKRERQRDEAAKWLKLWNREELTIEQARHIANHCHLRLPRIAGDSDRLDFGPGAYDVIDAIITGEPMKSWAPRTLQDIVDYANRCYPVTIAYANRWIAHYEMRLVYERSMLDSQGGLKGDQYDLQIGGRVKARNAWYVVKKINKRGGEIVSLRVANGRWDSKINYTEIDDYQAPTADEAATVQAAVKKPPVCNYPREDFVAITKAQWASLPRDYKGTGTREPLKSTEAIGAHCIRHAHGRLVARAVGAENIPEACKKGEYWADGYLRVYITDQKRTDPPALTPKQSVSMPVRVEPVAYAPRQESEARKAAQELKEHMKSGIQAVVVNQLFETPKEVAEQAAKLLDVKPGDSVLEPSAGTGMLLGALGGSMFYADPRDPRTGQLVAVEINAGLAERLAVQFPFTEIIRDDFLAVHNIGRFDKIIMNPPFQNWSDIKHIQHALTMLKPGGRLVAICANGSRQAEQLKPLADSWDDLPEGTFAHAGTNVRTALIVINKSAEDTEAAD